MTPQGDPRIPYDQTDPMQSVGAPQQAAGPTGAALPGAALPPGAPDIGQDVAPTGGGLEGLLAQLGGGGGGAPNGGGLPQDVQGLAGGLGAGPQDPSGLGGASSTDNLTGNDLAALSQPIGDLQSPEDQQVAAMEAALNDPNTPPDQLGQLQQMLDLAARRRLAGLGGGAPQGGGLGA